MPAPTAPKTIVLQPVRSLLNPRFEGYKLKTDNRIHIARRVPLPPLPSNSTDINRGSALNIEDQVPSAPQTPYRKLEDRGRFNHLFNDPFGNGVVYVDGGYRVVYVAFPDKLPSNPNFYVLFQFPIPDVPPEHREYPSVYFASSTLLVASDGAGSIAVIHLNRDSSGPKVGRVGILKIKSFESSSTSMATHGDSDAGSSGTMTQDDLFSLFRSRTTGLSPCVLAASRFIPGTDELSVLVYQTVEELVDERPSSISFSSSSSSSTRPQPHSKKVRKAVFYLSLLQVQGISRLSSQPTSPLPSSPQSFASSSAVNLDTKVLTTVKGLSGPYYVAIEPNGEGFVVASEIPYEVARSRTPSPSASPARTSQQEATDTSSSTTSALTTKQGSNTSDIEYTWTQSEEDVTIHVRLPKMVLKSEVKCDFQPSSIKLRIVQAATKQSLDVFASAAGGQEVAQLYHPIIPSECLWTIEKNRLLTLHLTKSTRRHRWPHVFAQDDGVLESLDPNEIAEFRDKLERFTSSSSDELMEIDSGSRSRLGLGAGGSSSSSSNNIADENPFSIHQQSITSRTEAEDFEGQSVTVRRFSHTGDLTHEARGGGHEWMCCAFEGSAPSSQSDSSARTGMRPVCLKLDIDGLIYALGTPSIASDSFALNHVGTFPALGFVRASKKDRRFTFVTTKETGDVGGWAVIVENKRHVYLYGNGGESQQQQSSSRHLYADQYIVDLDEDGDVEMVDSTTRGSGDSNVIGVQQIRGGIVVLRTGDLVVIAMGEV